MASDPAKRAGAILEIDLAGIAANWRLLAQIVEPAICAAVVKADAYGLGAAQVSAALASAGCRLFFTATIEEGIALRSALPEPFEIAVFNGALSGCAEEFIEYRLVPVLNDPDRIAEWEQIAVRQGELPAMLHLDTGMARLGLTMRDFDRLAGLLSKPSAIRWRGLISHLACADEPAHPLNEVQQARFASARSRLRPIPASLAASSGIFLGRAFHFDFVRPGAALYGINPQSSGLNPMSRLATVQRTSWTHRDGLQPSPSGMRTGGFARCALAVRAASAASGFPLLAEFRWISSFSTYLTSTPRSRGPAGLSSSWATITVSMRLPRTRTRSATRS
jgi:alanine racemase